MSSDREPHVYWQSREFFLLDEPEHTECLSCGATEGLANDRGLPFCATCIDRSRQAGLDELFDDLGCGD